MEEGLSYSGDKRASSKWHLGTSSALSVESEPSKLFYQHKNYHLHLVQKKAVPSDRQNIPSSKLERLSYYRTYISSPNKTQIICMQHVQFNRFLWYYILNVFFKSLPHTFVHMFLAAYAPEEHLFLQKMVPISYGCKYSFLMTAFLELLGYIDTAVLLLDYVICGIFYRNPWNRCEPESHFYAIRNATVNCYTLDDFAKKFVNGTAYFKKFAYVNANETFQVSQIEYYRNRRQLWLGHLYKLYFTVIWLAAALAHKQVYRKKFWKILNTVQCMSILVDLMSFTYLAVSYFKEQFGNVPDIAAPVDELTDLLWKADIDMLAESTTAPPVVHVLTSRSIQEIEPSRDTAIMITSNALYFIFRGLLTYRLKKHIENIVRAPIQLTDLNQHSWFYFWPMYFSTFYLGDLYTIVFLGLNLTMEFLAITVTYYCLVEVFICEWKWAKRWIVISCFFVIGVAVYLGTSFDRRLVMYIYAKAIATLTEVLVLYGLYPLGRLVDDITFHCGIPPTGLRILSMRFVPVFYTLKCYTMLEAFIMVVIKSNYIARVPDYYWIWSLMLFPMILGVFYICYEYVFKQRKSWQLMFRPVENWGPRDYTARQLRKQYDSRVYVGSQAPRDLSRYLIRKAEPKAYRLDIRYESDRRSTVVNTANAHFEDEKKFV